MDKNELEGIVTSVSAYRGGTPFSDQGNAERLIARYGQDLRYDHTAARWLHWTGTHWGHDDAGRIVSFAVKTVRHIYEEAADCEDQDARRKLCAHATRSEDRARLEAMVALARYVPSVAVNHSQLNSDPWLLNARNGTIDLRRGTLRPQQREDFITYRIDIEHNPNATCPRWIQFLDEVFQKDPRLIKWIQRSVGYTITGSTREQVVFIPYGLGANGKSVFVGVLSALLGKLARRASFDTFLSSRSSGSATNDVASLAGARLVTANESEDGRSFDEAKLKDLTGGDTITARFLYREFFEFVPTFKLWLSTNHRPYVKGNDYGIWRRIRLIPFLKTFTPECRDPELMVTLLAELPGILNWAIEGCLDWQRGGLGTCDAVRAASEDYREAMDTLGEFVDQRCAIAPELCIPLGRLYEIYAGWTEEEAGEKPLSRKAFSQRMIERLPAVARNKSNGVRYLRGIGLRGEPQADVEE